MQLSSRAARCRRSGLPNHTQQPDSAPQSAACFVQISLRERLANSTPACQRSRAMALLPRALYPTLAQCRYLNQASLGLISQPAVEQMRLFLDDVAQHGNLHMTCAVQWLVLAASMAIASAATVPAAVVLAALTEPACGRA
jgi:hypothetical protein